MASTVASQSFHLMINEQLRRNIILLTSYLLLLTSLVSCSSGKYISKQAKQTLLSDSNLTAAHVGISIYDASANKYLYNYQADKYFIPASNTKIFTCYAAMKHLGDSLVGLRYQIKDSLLIFQGTGDPTLLHPDFKKQPILNFLSSNTYQLRLAEAKFKANRWSFGWSVGDINESYMPERSELPVYGNILTIKKIGDSIITIPKLFTSNIELPEIRGWRISFERPSLNENIFSAINSNSNFRSQEIPFVTGNYMSSWVLLIDTLKKNINLQKTYNSNWQSIHSQPTDSLLKPMMHRSDNFFAEQTLLMVSNEMTGVMNDAKIIDSLLKTDFKDIPQKPRWVDGSGLSRYNLFSPQDFVHVLNKMKNEFEWNRITIILPTGGEGTLTNYYINLKDRIFAKTGTLSNNLALSGFLISKKNKTIIFSVLVNNHMGNTTQIRRAVEKFLTSIAEKF
jgi:D-alanyl-D-alanine carboxypeptidase/D-alanyl-D-alanine-endopeptidase (penicillin-binding protein 4)